ncbi:MAG: hypothetical protein M1840_004323, partial [Geoglossum simile]
SFEYLYVRTVEILNSLGGITISAGGNTGTLSEYCGTAVVRLKQNDAVVGKVGLDLDLDEVATMDYLRATSNSIQADNAVGPGRRIKAREPAPIAVAGAAAEPAPEAAI